MRTADLGAPARSGARDGVLFREAAGASQLLPLTLPPYLWSYSPPPSRSSLQPL